MTLHSRTLYSERLSNESDANADNVYALTWTPCAHILFFCITMYLHGSLCTFSRMELACRSKASSWLLLNAPVYVVGRTPPLHQERASGMNACMIGTRSGRSACASEYSLLKNSSSRASWFPAKARNPTCAT